MTTPSVPTPPAPPAVATSSGIQFVAARVSNFRQLQFVDVTLEPLTIILGANNAGKSSFLEALCMAIGAQRRTVGKDDIHLAAGEVDVPRDRKAIVDLLIRPTDTDGNVITAFPAGSYWTELFGTGISQDENFADFVGIRATLAWNIVQGEYRVERKFLQEWVAPADFEKAVEKDRVAANHLEPLGLHYIDAKRDMDEDLRSRTSFWRRLTDDLGLDAAAVTAAETMLSDLNRQLVDGSAVLKHVGGHLGGIKGVLAGDQATVDISPVARRLRDLAKGLDVSITGVGDLSFPLARHGMGTRSLAAVLVFQAFASWRSQQASKDHSSVHTFLALEEPEAHLHPHAQRALYSQVSAMPAQVVVSTHSSYFAGQAKLGQLRLFRKDGARSNVAGLDLSALQPNDTQKLENKIMLTRGDLLFSSALLLFEGETEEAALPIFAQRYWGSTIHQLGLSFVPVGGGDYFPFIWLANQMQIPWFILSDSEPAPLLTLDRALAKAGLGGHATLPNVVKMDGTNDFEAQLVADGYHAEIEAAFNEYNGVADHITGHIARQQGQQKRGGGVKDFSVANGRSLAILDAMHLNKTSMAVPIASKVSAIVDPARATPPHVRKIFEAISASLGLITPKVTP